MKSFRMGQRWFFIRIAKSDEPYWWHREEGATRCRTYFSIHGIRREAGFLHGLIIGRFYFATIKPT